MNQKRDCRGCEEWRQRHDIMKRERDEARKAAETWRRAMVEDLWCMDVRDDTRYCRYCDMREGHGHHVDCHGIIAVNAAPNQRGWLK